MKKYLYLLLSALVSIGVYSQGVGINQVNPQSTLDITSSGTSDSDKVLQIKQYSTSGNYILLRNDGKLGIDNNNPSVKLDVRKWMSGVPYNAIGIGFTSATASDAGAGALRYTSESAGRIHLSDGILWNELVADPQLAFIGAVYAGTGAVYHNEVFQLMVWSENQDIHNDFNPTTGGFKAPRTGVYSFSCTVSAKGRLNKNKGGFIEVFFSADNGITVKSTSGYINSTSNDVDNTSLSVSLSSLLSLEKGSEVRIYFYNYTGNPVTITTGSASFLSIIEV